MRVKMLKERREQISPLRTRIYRRDLVVDIDDDLASAWIAQGAAVAVVVPDAVPQLTANETAVLKAAAGQILAETSALLASDAVTASDADPDETDGAVAAPPVSAPATKPRRPRKVSG